MHALTLDSANATLHMYADGTLDLSGANAALTVSAGTFDLGAATLQGGTVTSTGGLLEIESGATLDGVTWRGTIAFSAGPATALYVTGGLTMETATGGSPGSIDLSTGGHSLNVLDSETLNNATLNFGSGSSSWLTFDYSHSGVRTTLTLGSGFTLDQTGGNNNLSNSFANDTIANAGLIAVSGGVFTVSGGGFNNSGTMSVSGGATTVDLSGVATLNNAGLIAVNGGSFDASNVVFANSGTMSASGGAIIDLSTTTLSNTGLIEIGTNSGVLLGSSSDTAGITFNGTDATLVLNAPSSYTGTISGMAASDGINLTGIGYDSGGSAILLAGNVLQIVESTNTLDLQLNPAQNFTGDSFQLSSLSGGSAVTELCYLTGTRIATPSGEVCVEQLAAGDLVCLADGGVAPVRWLGHHTVSRRFGDPLRTWPIRVRAGALAENVPSRDLLLSPGHALRVGDVLAHAAALVNGVSIVRETQVPETFVYWHVELDTHALILAENTPAETFLDSYQELAFDNRASRPAPPQGLEELPYSRAKAPRQVPRLLREALAARAAAYAAA
ncbi:MAG: Hint domain-containing protein [Rhodospirillales bacterium]|nr:Hint domain-containing protein [Rhodospirillales bacterium]